MPEFVQTNTESTKQLKKAAKQEKTKQEQDQLDVHALLGDPRFRRFVWRVLEKTKMFETIWDPNGSRLNYNSGAQDIGHWLWELLENARPDVMLDILAERQRGEL